MIINDFANLAGFCIKEQDLVSKGASPDAIMLDYKPEYRVLN